MLLSKLITLSSFPCRRKALVKHLSRYGYAYVDNILFYMYTTTVTLVSCGALHGAGIFERLFDPKLMLSSPNLYW